MDADVMNILAALEELKEDDTVPRNIKSKLSEASDLLQAEGDELKVKINKVQQLLEEVSEDSNVKAYTRSQLWGVVSMLEAVDRNL